MQLREEFVERSQAHHQARRRMSRSAKATTRGQRKGRNTPSRHSPPLPPPSTSSSTPASAPAASSGAHGQFNPVLARQQGRESKYPLWKYVTRKEGLGAKLGGGGNVYWSCNFYKKELKSTSYRVKRHLFALPLGISSCKAVSNTQRRKMEKEDHVGQGKVAKQNTTE